MANHNRTVKEFISTLKDLRFNSKPMITMLTHVARENIERAEEIFEAIKMRLAEVPSKSKLPLLYLFDAIIKNVGNTYKTIFCNEIVSIIRTVYLEMNQEDRKRILQLRRTWNDVIPINILRLLDFNIQHVDRSWLPNLPSFNNQSNVMSTSSAVLEQSTQCADPTILSLQLRILEIQKELLGIQQQKYELDCREALIKSQQEQISQNTNHVVQPLNEEKADSEDRRSIIRDPRLLSRQQRNAGPSITADLQKNNKTNQKKSSCNDCSSIMVAKNKGIKRPSSSFSSEEDRFVCKKPREETCNYSSEKVPSLPLQPQTEFVNNHSSSPTELNSNRKQSESNPEKKKETCSFKTNGVRAAPYQKELGENSKMHKISLSQAQKRSRWDEVSEPRNLTFAKQDYGGRTSCQSPLAINKEERPSNNNSTLVRSEGPFKDIVGNGTDGASNQHDVNVQELFQKLVSSGMINNSSKAETTPVLSSSFGTSKENSFNFHSLTSRAPSIVQALYQGNQCESCGVRFSQDQSTQYKEHLDWHLQQKRKGGKIRNNGFPQEEGQTTRTFNSRPNFSDPKSLKIRQSSVIQSLYQGQQCGTCGERFSSEQSVEYKEHLDWHFRKNRKIKETKVSRHSWYWSSSNWTNYHKEEDEENYFELQKDEGTVEKEEVDIPCIRADFTAHGAYCEVCHDKFEEFYNENEEEWQLRMAIRVESKIYHPLCYQDYQVPEVDAARSKSLLDVSIKFQNVSDVDDNVLNKSNDIIVCIDC